MSNGLIIICCPKTLTDPTPHTHSRLHQLRGKKGQAKIDAKTSTNHFFYGKSIDRSKFNLKKAECFQQVLLCIYYNLRKKMGWKNSCAGSKDFFSLLSKFVFPFQQWWRFPLKVSTQYLNSSSLAFPLLFFEKSSRNKFYFFF